MKRPGKLRGKGIGLAEKFCWILGLTLVFWSALVLGAVIHVDLPLARRMLARGAEQLTHGALEGELKIGAVDTVGLFGIQLSELRLIDSAGQEVLHIDRLRTRTNLIALLRTLLLGDGERPRIVFTHTRADSVECLLRKGSGAPLPSLAQVFVPLTRGKAENESPPVVPELSFPDIEVGRAWCRSSVPELPPFDVDLKRIHANLILAASGPELHVDRFGGELRGLGGAPFQLTGEFHMQGANHLWGSLDGSAGTLPFAASAAYRDQKLRLRLDLPRARFDEMRSLWPAWPIRDQAALQAEVTGRWPSFFTHFSAQVKAAQVTGKGVLKFTPDPDFQANFMASHLDLRSVLPDAPATDFGGRARVVAFRSANQVNLSITTSLEATEVAGVAIPALELEGTLDGGHLLVHATAREPGIPLKADLHLTDQGELSFEAHAAGFRTESAPRIQQHLPLRGFVGGKAKGKLSGTDLGVDFEAQMNRMVLGEFGIESGKLRGKLSGRTTALDALTLEAQAEAQRISVYSQRFEDAKLSLRGPLTEPQVKLQVRNAQGARISFQGRIAPGVPRTRDVELAWERGDQRITARISDLARRGDTLTLHGLEIAGSGGTLKASGTYHRDALDFEVEGQDLELRTWAEVLGNDLESVTGKVRVSAAGHLGNEGSRGNLEFELTGGRLADQEGLTARVLGRLEGRKLDGEVAIALPQLGGLITRVDSTLAGSPWTAQAWTAASGQADIELRQMELNQLLLFIPSDWAIQRLEGKAEIRARLTRPASAGWPDLTATMETRGLEVERVVVPGNEAEAMTSQLLQGVDLVQGISVSGESGYLLGTAQIGDAEGTLATVSSQSQIDFHRLWEDPSGFFEGLMKTPVEAVATLPERDLSKLPALLRPSNVTGQTSGKITLSGTLNDPVLGMQAKLNHLATPGMPEPIDALASAQYQKNTGHFSLSAELALSSRAAQPLAILNAEAVVPASEILATDWNNPRNLKGEAEVSLYQLPISALPGLAQQELTGVMDSGKIALAMDRGKTTLRGSAHLLNTKLGRTGLGDGDLGFTLNDSQLRSELRFNTQQSWFNGTIDAPITWSGGLPNLDPSRPAQATVDAYGLPAGALAPFTRAVLDDIEGRIDASLRVVLRHQTDPAPPPAAPGDAPAGTTQAGSAHWHPTLAGTVVLHNGRLRIAGMGLELTSTECMVGASATDTLTHLHIQGFQAQSRSSQPNLKATGDLYLDGIDLLRGAVNLSAQTFPIPVGGIPLASASGAASLAMTREPARMRIDVNVPSMILELPRTVGRTVLSTDDNPSIEVVQPMHKKPREASTPGLPIEFLFTLGDRVRVRRRDLDLDLPISGQPQLILGTTSHVNGYIDLDTGGTIPLLGKVFRIDSGRLWLDPLDTGNPLLNITASWQAAEATVYVKMRGRWKAPSLHLESDPAYSEEQLWVLLQGGTLNAPGAAGQGQTGGAQAAYGTAMALGVDQLFSDTPLHGLEVTPDTQRGETAYRASYRVSDRVRLEGIYQPRGGIDKAPTQVGEQRSDAFAGAVEYRFHRDWSVRTQAGNASAGMDLLWQYRY